MSNKIQHIPWAGERIETGPVQFGDDWPGVFIRGDNAGYYGLNLKHVLESEKVDIGQHMVLTGLQSILSGCIITPAADMLNMDAKKSEGTPKTGESNQPNALASQPDETDAAVVIRHLTWCATTLKDNTECKCMYLHPTEIPCARCRAVDRLKLVTTGKP